MEVAAGLSPSASARTANPNRVLKASFTASFPSPFSATSGHTIGPESLNPSFLSRSKPKRNVVTNVIPFTEGSAWEQPPPDLQSYLFKNRVVYLGMPLVPSVTELMLAEFLYLQYEDEEKPIYMYINSTGTQRGGQKLGYETEALAVYDAMRHTGKSPEHIEADSRRPKYFTPSEAVEYGIDKVLYNERSTKDRGAVSDLKKAQLL